jgi:hypothetical protein
LSALHIDRPIGLRLLCKSVTLPERGYIRSAYQPPAICTFLSEQTSNQPAVLFSQNKPAPAISHQPTEHAADSYAENGMIRVKKLKKNKVISL